jgi:hypothetical protein
MKEIIIKLLEIKEYLIKEINGNYANQKNQMEIYNPYIAKIDELLDKLSDKLN